MFTAFLFLPGILLPGILLPDTSLPDTRLRIPDSGTLPFGSLRRNPFDVNILEYLAHYTTTCCAVN
jgi:hypothetical protein